MTAGGNSFNDFAENQLTCVPENISFLKIWGSKYHVDPQANFRGDPRGPTVSAFLSIQPPEQKCRPVAHPGLLYRDLGA